MPGFDGTGPFGDGRPGRGLGPCGRFDTPVRRGFGRGRGRGRGFGGGYGYRNRGHNYDAPVDYDYREPVYAYSKEDMIAQKDELEKQLQWLNDQLSKDESK
ncbi:MAG: DUF5320 domain-containing protein [Candidatus Cloacimonadaceae bacterium]|jgi:hypothetical protein|nr:DUF5320 domain-containing protein [Candidatus Cloacimonadota bacterium]MDY0127960.1 DUF5320 domain-containing protein [Candidatus Cloacimonadaceae bacterium]MCB5254120.1 DUF5320 domain-containing protein [Candidatus Cloacimonadota bacterium]MCK9178575.1 DUF5320 domain-containing protein [Candidatus Cloacimonadota bacterium]MCK9242402.1 DUF5320 domain-containing protein [Candidatus Cloacimonadota bacterium]